MINDNSNQFRLPSVLQSLFLQILSQWDVRVCACMCAGVCDPQMILREMMTTASFNEKSMKRLNFYAKRVEM